MPVKEKTASARLVNEVLEMATLLCVVRHEVAN